MKDRRPKVHKNRRTTLLPRNILIKFILIATVVALLVGLGLPGASLSKPLLARAAGSTSDLTPKDKVGAQLIWLWREDEATMERIFGEMNAAGIEWLRTDFGWGTFEPLQGQWDWDRHDIFVKKATDHRIKLLGILSSTPSWANGKGDAFAAAFPPSPEKMDTWNTYVNTVCKRYGADVTAWEIWNEENILSFSVDSGDKVAIYMNLVKRASDEIRKPDVDPNATIVLGGVAGYDPGFIETCLKKDNGIGDEDTIKGAADYVDAVAFHPYPFVTNLWNGNPHPHEREMREKLRELHSLIGNPVYSSGKVLQLWITEVGWTNSKDFLNIIEPATDTVDENTQAAYTLRTFLNYMDDYMYNAVGDCSVDKVFYYNLWGQYDRENSAYRTTDGGANWAYIAKGDYRQDVTCGFNGVSVLTENMAWAVGHFYQSGAVDTSTGGTTWDPQTTPANKFIHGVSSVANNSTAFAVGEGGTIIKVANQSDNWTSLTSGTDYNLNGVSAVNQDVVWVVGDNGIILKTINGGAAWSSQASGTLNGLQSISAVDQNTAWAVGINGKILKTLNGGTTWSPQVSGTTRHLRGVTAVDQNNAWAVGENGSILKTINGGTSWSPQSSGSVNYLNGVSAVDQNIAWAVGDRGTILKTTNGGANWSKQTAMWIPPSITPVEDTESCLTSVDALDASKAWVVGYRPTHAPVPITAGDYSSYVKGMEKYGMLHSTFKEKPVFNYLSRLVDASAGKKLFSDAVSISSGYLFASSNAPSTMEKHLFRTADGSLLLALWNSYNVNSNAFDPANDPDATLTFTFKNPSNSVSNLSFDDPLTVNLLDGTTQTTAGVSRDANGNITVSNTTIGKVPLILKFNARAGAPLALYSVKPGTGLSGMEVIIDGCQFGSTQGSSNVKFGSVQSTEYTLWSNNRIKCKVPAGLASGNLQITVTTASGTSNQLAFNIGVPIDAIAPNTGAQGSTVNITNLVGAGFQPGATVALELSGQTTMNATNGNVISSTQMTCTFSLTSGAGTYDVVVTNPDGKQGRLVGGFTVTAPAACGSGTGATIMLFGLMMGLMSLASGGALRRRLRRRSK